MNPPSSCVAVEGALLVFFLQITMIVIARLGLEATSEAPSSSSDLGAGAREAHVAAETGRGVLGGPRMSSPELRLGALTSRSAGALGWLSRL